MIVCGSNATILPSSRVPLVRKTVRMVPSSRHLASRGSWAGCAFPLFRVALPLGVFALDSSRGRRDRIHSLHSTFALAHKKRVARLWASHGTCRPRANRKRMTLPVAITFIFWAPRWIAENNGTQTPYRIDLRCRWHCDRRVESRLGCSRRRSQGRSGVRRDPVMCVRPLPSTMPGAQSFGQSPLRRGHADVAKRRPTMTAPVTQGRMRGNVPS
jgi:hypothetical protein